MSKLVQNYLLQEPIGKGVYGKVYRAIHQKTKGQFAVKAIPKSVFQANPKLQQLAINQIKILTSLRNDHIVKFIQTLKTPNNFYFVYEYCNGGALDSYLNKKKFLPQKEALSFFAQLLQAFKQLNKNSVMHRDLKPDNIFLSDGKIKLGDFGFCKMLEVNMAQTMLGSPIYMAPQILKQQIYTSKADIWSLGVVLFEMLFGYCPFQSSSINQLINVLKQTQLVIPTDINQISDSTKQLLQKILIKDQFKRIQWVDLFQYRLDQQGKLSCPVKKDYSSFQSIENYFLFGKDQLQTDFKKELSSFANTGSSNPSPYVLSEKQIKYDKVQKNVSGFTYQEGQKQNTHGSQKYIPSNSSNSPVKSPIKSPSRSPNINSNFTNATSFNQASSELTKNFVPSFKNNNNANTNTNNQILNTNSQKNIQQNQSSISNNNNWTSNNFKLAQHKSNTHPDYLNNIQNSLVNTKDQFVKRQYKVNTFTDFDTKTFKERQRQKQKQKDFTPTLSHQYSQQNISYSPAKKKSQNQTYSINNFIDASHQIQQKEPAIINEFGANSKQLKHTNSGGQIPSYIKNVKEEEKRSSITQNTSLQQHTQNKNSYSSSTLPKKQSKTFQKKHEEWTKIFQALQQMTSNPKYQKQNIETITYWTLISLNKKINQQSQLYPQWTDVILQQKKAIAQSLKEMNKLDPVKYKDFTSQKQAGQDGKNQILKFWKRCGNSQFKQSIFEKMIRFMYTNDHNIGFTVQQILLT